MERLMSAARAGGVLAALAAGLLVLAACGPGDPAGGRDDDGRLSGTVTVFAAASLTETFSQIGRDFEAANPGVTVRFNFGGSSTLATQINEGAPADVFVSASPANMQAVIDAGSATGPPTVSVRNQLVIAVPTGNPLNITSLADLADPDLKVALCAAQVPCGAASVLALEAGGVSMTPVTFELDVKAALSKVTLGEVDAALVYRTDAAAEDAVEGVEFPASEAAINDYPIIVLDGAPNPAAARAFVDYVLSGPALAVLTRAGFQTP
jgi:molybdate transport system substrate-binding protein